MEKHMIPFGLMQNGKRELIDLVFSKKADDRKEWLQQFRVRLLLPPTFVMPSAFDL
jgi:hypothetical protein